MLNLRQQVEKDLEHTLEGEWQISVILISPDGVRYSKSANDATKDLVAQVMYETSALNPDTGSEVVYNKPVISLRRTSLTRIPAVGEVWLVRMPKDPTPNADLHDFVIKRSGADRGGRSIGYIKFYLQGAEQS